MFVSIRDEIVMQTGFDSLHEALTYFDLRNVEMLVNRDMSVRSLHPTADQPRLFLDRPDDLAKLERQTKGSGLNVTAFLIHNDFNSPRIEQELAWTTGVVQAAGTLGAPAVRTDSIMSGQNTEPLARRQQVFADAVRAVLDLTPKSRVSLAIENHGAQGNDPAFLDGVFAKVNSKRLGMTLDIGNFYWSGKPLSEVYRIIEHFAPLARHTHVKNIRYPEELREQQRAVGYEYAKYECPIPDGDLDITRIVGYLKKAGYRNDLCIEDESLGKYDIPARRENVKAAIRLLRNAIGQ
ncbi:MAG TPA: TIM barrel protein [Chthonomonadaceae bacterium]|nr:TIM barrel protein [Chthonomonadaceae bacterium]